MGAPGDNVSVPVHTVLDEIEPAAHVRYNTGEDLMARLLDELTRLSAIPEHDAINRDIRNSGPFSIFRFCSFGPRQRLSALPGGL
jgi:hypothetical protein